MFEKVCVVGLGLIGASLAQAMLDKGLTSNIVACDFNQQSLEIAKIEGLITDGAKQLSEMLPGCDLIIIAVPVKAVLPIFRQIAQAKKDGVLAADCITTDVCSTKMNVIEAVREASAAIGIEPINFVAGHPIAGAENSGVQARNGRLFLHHHVILCPEEQTNPDAIKKIRQLWQAVGADVSEMSAEDHDRILAHTSHLPHLLAFNLVNQLTNHNDNMNIFRYAAGGFRDFSRIAASDPTMWHDIFLANKPALLTAIDDYQQHLEDLKQLIIEDDSAHMIDRLAQARFARRHFGHMLDKTAYMERTLMTQTYVISPSQQFTGTHTVAGDKSISHRSIMLGSLADGVTTVTGFLQGEDALATLQAFRDMGVEITDPVDGKVMIKGVGVDGLKPAKKAIYMGNSGTSMRLLSGILSAQNFDSVMTGDPSLSKRPMERVAKPLREMGAKIQTTGDKGTPPMTITGGQTLTGIHYDMPMASAQVKSCLLLAGIWAKGTTTVVEPEITRDHTERMLTAFGYSVTKDGNAISITGGGRLTATDIAVPADISSAAFFMVAGAIAQQGNVTIKQVGINPTRTGVIDILKLMGADLTLTNEAVVGGEPVADIVVKSSKLKGIEIPAHLVPLAIDEFPVLFVAASCAEGKTVLHGAEELRVKESDRIQVMADGLKTLGINCTVLEDGIVIEGRGDIDHVFGGGEIESHHDHRIAMSFTVASLRASDTITIHGTETVNTSFPGFAELANSAGLNVSVE
jgi:3-phosphoshikimate 1-carboxyvinyltransferase